MDVDAAIAQQVGDELVAIARLVRQALFEARSAFLETELETAQGVISNDARIDLLQDELDERSIDILARQSPVASDLRTLVEDVPTQDVISRDNVSVKVNAVVYYRVLDA